MYVRKSEKPSEQAFAELEAVVGPKGRRLYGVFDEGAGRYWAWVQRREQDDLASLGLRMGTIEGGLYASERLSSDHEAMVALIATPFEAMGLRHAPLLKVQRSVKRHVRVVSTCQTSVTGARRRDSGRISISGISHLSFHRPTGHCEVADDQTSLCLPLHSRLHACHW